MVIPRDFKHMVESESFWRGLLDRYDLAKIPDAYRSQAASSTCRKIRAMDRS